MALVRINLEGLALVEHATGKPAEAALRPYAGGVAPIVIMIHGFKFSPASADYCPHDHILSLRTDHTCWKAKSWPRELGIDAGSPSLGIAFGWPARGSIWQAYQQADLAGRALAELIRHLRGTAPDRPINILAHSLGARVALSALPHLPPQALARALLLAGAEFRVTAEDRLDTPAGRTCEIISVTSRENRPYDRLLERALAGPHTGRAIGREAPNLPNWLDLPLDDAQILKSLATQGHAIAPPQRWVCHWSSYLRPGVFSLYSALVADSRPLPLATLKRMMQAPHPTEIEAKLTGLWSQLSWPSLWGGRTAG